MGKLKAILITLICLAIAVLFGFFLLENQNEILVDVLYRSSKMEISVGRFAMALFLAGLLTGFFLCIGFNVIQSLELRASRKEVRKLTSQLEKLREMSFKDAA